MDQRVFSIVFSVVGSFILAASSIWMFRVFTFTKSAHVADGVVIETPYGGSHPRIKFMDYSGNEIVFTQGGLVFGYRVGDRVKVAYKENSPKISSIDGIFPLWGFPFLATVLGIFFLTFGIFRR
jgi:hypothetical protein